MPRAQTRTAYGARSRRRLKVNTSKKNNTKKKKQTHTEYESDPFDSDKENSESQQEEQEQEQEENYEVEAIHGKRTNSNGQTEYHVKWLNYPSTQNTWYVISLHNNICTILITFIFYITFIHHIQSILLHSTFNIH